MQIMSEFDVKIISDRTLEDGTRALSFQTCGAVCSMQIDLQVKDDIIKKVEFTKGCNGNTQGVSSLCVGMKVEDVISRLDGISCKGRGTSCPDQLAKALKYLSENK